MVNMLIETRLNPECFTRTRPEPPDAHPYDLDERKLVNEDIQLALEESHSRPLKYQEINLVVPIMLSMCSRVLSILWRWRLLQHEETGR